VEEVGGGGGECSCRFSSSSMSAELFEATSERTSFSGPITRGGIGGGWSSLVPDDGEVGNWFTADRSSSIDT